MSHTHAHTHARTCTHTHTHIHTHTHTASQTVRQLSEMIDGLDSMMADLHTQSLSNVDQPPTASSSTKQEKRLSTSSPDLLQDGTMRQTNEDTGQTGLTGSQLAHALGDSALSIAAPSFNDLLTQSEGTHAHTRTHTHTHTHTHKVLDCSHFVLQLT